MKKSLFALSILSFLTLCLPTHSQASDVVISPYLKGDGGNCSIPAPLDFHIQSKSHGSVLFGWTPFTAQAQHRIRIYRSSDNALVRTEIAPSGATLFEVDSLPTGLVGYAKINPICNDGSHSTNESTIPDFGVPILDLVVKIASPNVDAFCTIDAVNESCPFPNAIGEFSQFRITKGPIVCNFDIFKTTFDGRPKYVCIANAHENFKFYCQDGAQLTSPPCQNTRMILIKFKSVGAEADAAAFQIDDNTFTFNALKGTSLASGYKIERLFSMNENWQSPGTDNNETESHLPFPNPFDKELTLPSQITFKNTTNLNLINLNGQVVLSETIPANQSSHTLSTAHLAPGFYFLRIEADGEVQTFKVIKSAQ